ncbi:hypothetical protein [Actinoplanes philippinensis]|uniref:hypothetical protein n=1 Tax=Actinoplanes philippinensis TaxID=35752 RepID=UPI0033C17738
MTASLVDRVVRWNVDIDGDSYGDERERYRWYEGTAAASTLHSLLIPWAAAIMVWPLGRPAVLPLAVVLVLLWGPMLLCSVYVARRRVDTNPRGWIGRRAPVTVLSVVPYSVFTVGALHAYRPAGEAWIGAVAGGAYGVMLCVLLALGKARRREQRTAYTGDED